MIRCKSYNTYIVSEVHTEILILDDCFQVSQPKDTKQ